MQLSGPIIELGFHAYDYEPHLHEGVRAPREWVVVADRSRANIYRKTRHGLEKIAEAQADHNIRDGHLGALHHGYDRKSNHRYHDDALFIFSLSEWLDQALGERAFDRIVLVTPPHMLGDIRQALSRNVRKHIVAEVHKDMVKLSPHEIQDHLCDLAWF
jgi:protein required for attachment to host cells